MTEQSRRVQKLFFSGNGTFHPGKFISSQLPEDTVGFAGFRIFIDFSPYYGIVSVGANSGQLKRF